MAEETASADETALEFTLPGDQLEVALSALSELDARVVGTRIDVDAEQVDRFAPSAAEAPDGDDETEADAIRPVRLRVEVTEAAAPGAGALLQLGLWVFAAIGVVASWQFVARRWAARSARAPSGQRRARTIGRVEHDGDPPTQETPRVTPPW